MLRTALTIGVAASVFLVCLLILLGILGERLTTQTLVTSALDGVIPLLVIVPTFLWLDRYEAEPARYIVFAFLWGALVAVVGAFFLNTFGLKLLVEARWTDPLETGAVYLAPITEETLKGLGILLIYLLRRREFDGIIDGIVYARSHRCGLRLQREHPLPRAGLQRVRQRGPHRRPSSCAGSWAPSGTRSSPRSPASASASP